MNSLAWTGLWVAAVLALGGACGKERLASPEDGGAGGAGGGSGGGGATSCGPSTCGQCAPGCQPLERCEAGNWVCACDCGDGGTPTWYRDVLPIVQRRCQGCHRPGGIGSFPLTSYAEASSRHAALASAVVARRMPPWMPSPDCQSFRDERVLSQDEVGTLARWSSLGAPEGAPAHAPPPWDAGTGLSPVHAALDAGVDYVPHPPPNQTDDYRCLVLDPGLTQTRYLVGYEILPGVPRQVHHVLLFDTPAADAKQKDDNQAGPGWTCFGGAGVSSARMVGGWVPGTSVTLHPPGTGVALTAGNVLVMQVHYNTLNGPAAPDRTVVKLQYSAGPVAKPAQLLPLFNTSFSVPPNSTGYTATTSLIAPTAGTVWGIQPHMHLRGTKTRAEFTAPGPATQCLIDIPNWSFGWQQMYFYASPSGVRIPAGAQLRLSCTWDNPTTQSLTWGEGTTEEMCGAVLYVTQ